MKLQRRSQSKRQTLKQKYKVEKKVKEHHKKMRKALKKNALNKRTKLKKDPGIPNLFPYKQELLEKIIEKREKEKEEKEKLKEEKKMLKEKNKEMQDEEFNNIRGEIAKLRFNAEQRDKEFKAKQSLLGIEEEEDEFKDLKTVSLSHSTKQSYYSEFKKVVEKSDVIIEVLDARDPLGCRSMDIEKTILTTNSNIKIILLLNKIDLVPKEVLQNWLKYLRKDFPTIGFKSNTQNQKNNLGKSESNSNLKSGLCIGSDSLIKLLKNYCRSEDIKRSITVGIIGYPNVGKSSVINSLKRNKSVNVGSTPGLTKQMQEIHLDKNIKLLDSPGIIFDSKSLDSQIILRNAVRIEQLEDPITPVATILERCDSKQLTNLYNISEFKDVNDFLTLIAKKRGKLKKGGEPNLEDAAKVILNDWNSGKISFFALPPNIEDDKDEDKQFKDFDQEILDSNEILTLKEAYQKDFVPMITVESDNEDISDEDIEDENIDEDEEKDFEENDE